MTDRYTGKPMLRLLDSFVLDTVGALDEGTAGSLVAMTPKLRATFGLASGTWQDVVRSALELGDEDVAWIRFAYQQQLAHDAAVGQEPHVVGWAYAVSDHLSGTDGR